MKKPYDTFKHLNFCKFHLTWFRTICDHHPKGNWLPVLKHYDMTVNGPQCKTKRWWLYFWRSSLLIDWN